MQEFIQLLQNIDLFAGICTENIAKILNCTKSATENFHEGEYIVKPNADIGKIAVILKGKAHIISEDFCGNSSIISEINEGEIFCEAYALAPYERVTYSAVAQCPTTVVFIDIQCIQAPCKELYSCQLQLFNNLLRILARKNIGYMQKMEHISKRSTRQKLLSYFTEQMHRYHSPSFDISFNRQQLADYLSVDRSAMSSELSKMQKDGLIRYNLNHFELLFHDDSETFYVRGEAPNSLTTV